MFENENDVRILVRNVKNFLRLAKKLQISDLLDENTCFAKQTGYDNWNGGTYIYSLIVQVPLEKYHYIEESITNVENEILIAFSAYLRNEEDDVLEKVVISPLIDKDFPLEISNFEVDLSTLIDSIKEQRQMLINVGIGEVNINDVNDEYMSSFASITLQMGKAKIKYPNEFANLWEWHNYWKVNQLTTYSERRSFIYNLFDSILRLLENQTDQTLLNHEPTGWVQIDKDIKKMANLLKTNPTNSECSMVGHIARATMNKIGHEVYDYIGVDKENGEKPGFDDSKRILSNFIADVLPGSSNERVRKYARAAIELTPSVDHNQQATILDAKLCYISVSTVANIIKLLEDNMEFPF